jgi:hypothetical protein
MKKVNLKMRIVATIVAVLAATMMTSCGGGSSNKGAAQSGDSEKTEATVKKVENIGKWPDNHFTKQIPKLDFAINSDGVDVSETNTIIRFSDAKPTKEQITVYWEKVKAAGFTKNTMNSDDDLGYSFSASNEAGYRVELNGRSLKIGKQRADGFGIE